MDRISREKAKRYATIKTRNTVIDIVLSILFLLAFQFFLSKRITVFFSSMNVNFYFICLFYVSIFYFIMYMAGLPLSFYNSYIVEHRFNLSKESIWSWLKDSVKSLILSYFLIVVCAEVFYALLRNFPWTWWLIAALAWIFFTIVLARIFPVVIIPLFYKYSPIEDRDLKKEIFKMAEASGIDIIDVCKIDLSKKTAKANAALVGLGRTRKVILADTLLDNFDIEEIKAVVAHEFGHYKHKHIIQLLIFNSCTAVLGFFLLYYFADKIADISGAESISDLYIMPFLILILTLSGLVLMPFQNWFSRRLEKQADRFSLDSLSSAGPFIGAMKGLARTNLAEIDPSFLKKIFLYSHPTIKERISFAERYEK